MVKISIIVPVYNVEKYIRRCIDSILRQSFSEFELILVDDGSSDGSGQICDEYQRKDNRVRVFHQKNGGVSAARNLALDWIYQKKDSTVEWITFVDSDDWIHKDYLKILYEGAVLLNADICQCSPIDTSEMMVDDNEETKQCKVVTVEQALYKQGRFEIDCYAWGKVFRKSVFMDVRFPNGMTFEDIYIIPEVLLNSGKIAEAQARLYYYYQRPDSIVYSKKNMQYIENKWKGYEKNISLFEEYNQEKLAGIMKHAYVFWTQSLMDTDLNVEERKAVLARGREIIKRYSEVSGYPFHLNKDLLFSFYPILGNVYRTFSKVKNMVKKDSV